MFKLTWNIQIQAAHETLSDSAKRQRYDSLVANPAFGDFGVDDEDDDENDDDDDVFGAFFFFMGARNSPFGFRAPTFDNMESDFQQAEAQEHRARQAEQEKARAARLAAALAEKQVKAEAAEKARKQREFEKKVAEDRATEAYEKREEAERVAQNKRWSKLKPKTEAEKQDTCLHSAFWAKIKLTKKSKCVCCGQKRGMAAFKCPHCSLQACQLCLTKFAQKRERLSSKG